MFRIHLALAAMAALMLSFAAPAMGAKLTISGDVTYRERIALPASFLLRPLIRLMSPLVWVVNLISGRLLKLLKVDTGTAGDTRLSLEELRTVVLESGSFMPGKHRAILLNLFDLENITVDDVMTPRQRVEALDAAAPERTIREQLATSFHNKLPVYQGEPRLKKPPLQSSSGCQLIV